MQQAPKSASVSPPFPQTLAKVVEGWNRHEAERTETLHRLQTEKEATEQALGKQREVRLGQSSWGDSSLWPRD